MEIGVRDGDADYLFHAIASGRMLPGGRIAVADAGYLDVRIFGPDGGLLSRSGGEGGGPGEFRSIEAMWLTPEGLLGVWDPTSRRITTLDLDGNLRAASGVRSRVEGNLEVFLGSYSSGSVVLAALRLGPWTGSTVADVWSLYTFTPEGEQEDAVGHVAGMRRFNRNPVPFSAMPYVAVAGDRLFVADGYAAEIAVRDADGTTIRTLTLPSADPDAGEAWASLEAELEASDKPLFLEYLREDRIPRSERIPQIGGLLVDDRGLLWVKRYDPRRDSIWLRKHALWPAPGGTWLAVRPANGSIVAEVEMPSNVRPLQIQGSRLLGVSVDADGVEKVVIHPIVR